MRILAIRGENLASLAREFDVELGDGPLAASGVFAIVGPTGAGKSTLLDAMCVALFDRTPRLGGRSSVLIGRGDDVGQARRTRRPHASSAAAPRAAGPRSTSRASTAGATARGGRCGERAAAPAAGCRTSGSP